MNLKPESMAALSTLKRHYTGHPIVLYTGAGVSTSSDKGYGVPLWFELLGELGGIGQTAMPSDPWKAADLVVERCGGPENLQKKLRAIIQRSGNFTGTHRQLRGRFLSGAPTLNAVVAFCASIEAVALSQRGVRVVPNHRVRAILTSNFDPYLESASSTMFRHPILKPVCAVGSSGGSLSQIPVFHIHGYVPHPLQNKKYERMPLVRELILTSKAYQNAWNYKDAHSATITTQIHYLRHYTALFIGFSFTDASIVKLLEAIRREQLEARVPEPRGHYTIVKSPTGILDKRRNEQFERMGVRPIVVADYAEVPCVLEKIYCDALVSDLGGDKVQLPVFLPKTSGVTEQTYSMTVSECWNALLRSRDCLTRFS